MADIRVIVQVSHDKSSWKEHWTYKVGDTTDWESNGVDVLKLIDYLYKIGHKYVRIIIRG